MTRHILNIMIVLTIVSYNVSAQFYAVYIPLEKLNGLNMDGDTSDWNWVPDKYFISTNNMVDVISNKEKNNKSWNCKIIVGWNEMINKIHILIIVRGNIKNLDLAFPLEECYLGDCLEVAINPDNLGGAYYPPSAKRAVNTVKLHFSLSSINNYKFELDNGSSWYLNKRYLDWGWRDYANSDNQCILVYEISTSLWDYWSDGGIEFSKESELFFNKVIRLTIACDDIDDGRKAQWVTQSGVSWYWNADDLSEFVLDSPNFENSSWQSINYLLKSE